MAEKTEAVAAYVAEVAKLAKTAMATEHSFRPALERLLSELTPGLRPINEPKRRDCGAPDFILVDRNGLPVMFVETKDLGDTDLVGVKQNKEQFDRYKAALETIVFTDFLDFRFYRRNGRPAGRVQIAEWDGAKVSAKSENFAEFVRLMGESASGEPQKIDSAERLAELMAGKARMLQRIAEAYLKPIAAAYDSAPEKAKPEPPPLLDMMLNFRQVLMHGAGPEEFSDIFAQTLTYGMFAARLNDPTPGDFSRYEAMGRIPRSNPFLKRLFQYVANNLEEELEWVVDDLADLFKAANVSRIMAGYGRSTGTSDPMVHFYEDFLREYDAGLRKDRGVWYTPIQVVRFIVSAVDWALRTRFGLPDGLADSSTTDITVEEVDMFGKKLSHKVKNTVHRVQVLDPATGTGTFLAETVRQIRAKFDGNEGLWPAYVAQNLLPRLNGFELLMASYTMAHVKLDFALRASGADPGGRERFRVFLTDSLTDWHKELPGGLFASALAAEQRGADEVKRDIPVMVVMGNPPYSGESQNKGDWIMKLMESYKVEPGGKMKLRERNFKWLNDDYVKFIRLAEFYVEKNGSGIVAYITPHGFLDAPTFRGMRWHLMETFDEIRTLNLHGNSKKKEVAPDGGKDECVFDIMQGVTITLFIRRQNSGKKTPCKVYYADLWGRRAEKFAALEAATMESIEWQELNPAEPMLFFVPKDTAGEAEWNSGFGIDELLKVNSTGVVSANDELNVSFTEEEQKEKINDLLSLPEHDWRAKYHRPKDSRDWKYSFAKADTKNSGRYCRAAYRIFDYRFTFYTGTSKGLYTNPRDSVMRHFATQFGNEGIVVKRGFPYPEERPVGFVTNGIIDSRFWSCSGMQGTDYVFPLWLYEEKEGKTEKRANMDPAIVAKMGEAIGREASPEEIFAYIYGVLHAPQYRGKFKEFLKSDFPRIPYPKDAAQFEAVAGIGRGLIETHLMRDAAPGLSETRARFPKPGGNRVEEVRFDAGRVFINAQQYFDNVPQAAWEMPIGGYRPAEKWLKDRKGRELTGDDIRQYQRIIIALLKTAEAAGKLEALPGL